MEEEDIKPDQRSGHTEPERKESLDPNTSPTVRAETKIMVSPDRSGFIDKEIVSPQYYNSFNYSLLADQGSGVHLTLGITSANRGEGKTLTASNLAVSLTLGYRKRTVLVDLNFLQPRLHELFGAPGSPGLADALQGGLIHVSSTSIENLYVLPAGMADNHQKASGGVKRGGVTIGVEHTKAFGEVINALQKEYDFVIVDMPAINRREFPILFLNHLEGVLVVVEARRTKRQDIERMFRHLNRNQVLGFVFNRVTDEED